MIVDFITIKEKLHQGSNIFLRGEIKKKAPFISMIGSRYLHEGDKHFYSTKGQEKKELKLKKGESTFSLTREEMNKITFKEISEKLQLVAEDMAGQMEKNAFRSLNEGMEKHNRKIPGNPPFSPDAFLQAVEMIEIDFANNDPKKPHLPTLIVSPELAQKIKEQEANMTLEEKKEFDNKMEKVMTKKYKEYMEREVKRKIID